MIILPGGIGGERHLCHHCPPGNQSTVIARKTFMDRTAETKQAFERPQWYLESRGYNIRIRAEIVQEVVQNRKAERILDIGCGNGSMSVPLLSPNNRLTLLDLSSSMLNIARSQVPQELLSHVDTVNVGFMQANLEPRTYDLIICLGVLAYVDDVQKFVNKLTILLKPGGIIIIECTDSQHFVSHLISAYEGLLGLFKPPTVHLYRRPSSRIIRAFDNVGYELRRAFRYSLPLPLVRKLFNDNVHYRMLRWVFGLPKRNRNGWIGNECIYMFLAGDANNGSKKGGVA